jgi:orotidine-5'-phosphate decarboxylase
MKDRLIVALDSTSRREAEKTVEALRGTVNYFKVGPALFLPCGPSIVRYLKSEGFKVFLDLKLHDIPNTVVRATEAILDLGVDIFNVHASGGTEMMTKTAELIRKHSVGKDSRPLLFAVTVLTSLKQEHLGRVLGSSQPVEDHVVSLARLARDAGCDGVVASSWETQPVKRECGPEFLVITPGIRPRGSGGDDQKRTKTPGEAVREGSDFIVVGRPITTAEDPRKMATQILEEMERNDREK